MGVFCSSYSLPQFPVLISTVSAFLALNFNFFRLSYSAIHCMVAGLQFHARLHDHSFPSLFSNSHISLLLRGFKRSSSPTPDKRLPITLNLLHSLVIMLRNGVFSLYLDRLFEAVILLAFYGFLRVGEFTTKSALFNASRDICISDLLFIHNGYKLFLKHSKSDRKLKGCHVSVARIFGRFCPHASMLRFLSVRKRTHNLAPLFLLPNGLPLYQSYFTLHFQTLIIKCGLPPDRYSSHSLRIGAATTAAASGVPSHTVKSMGRWTSSAYSGYIRLGASSVLDAQRSMASPIPVRAFYWWLL